MLVIGTTYLRARKWPLLLLYILLGFPFILAGILDDDSSLRMTKFYEFVIIVTHVFIILFWYYISRMEVQIYPESIAYKTVFKTRELNWKDIISSDLSFGFTGNHADVKWIFSSFKKNIIIHPSYFSRKDNQLLAEVVVAKCSSANISKSIKNMSHGKFPWYVF